MSKINEKLPENKKRVKEARKAYLERLKQIKNQAHEITEKDNTERV
jgi:hypothetical protein